MKYNPVLHSWLRHEECVTHCHEIFCTEMSYYNFKHISLTCVYVSHKTKIKLKLSLITVADMKIQCSRLNCSYGCIENGTNNYACFCQSGYSLADDAKSCEGMKRV